MINPFTLYLLLKLDQITGFLSTWFWIVGWSIVPVVVAAVAFKVVEVEYSSGDEDRDRAREIAAYWVSIMKKQIVALVVVSIVQLSVPSTKNALLIFGIPAVLESQAEAIQTLEGMPKKLLKMLDGFIDEQLQEDKK